jgi:hypothetical protein
MATTSTSDNNYVMNNNIIDVADDGEELLRKVMEEVNSFNDDEIKPISVMSSSTSSDNSNAVDDVDDNGDDFLRKAMAEAMATMNNFSSTITTSVLLPNADTNTYVDDTAVAVAAAPAAAPTSTVALPVVNNNDILLSTTVADVMAKSYHDFYNNSNNNDDGDDAVTFTTTNIAGHDDTTATEADDDVGNDEGNTNNHNNSNNNDSINEGMQQKIKTEPRDSVWVLYNGNNNNINSNSSRCAMKNDIENSKCDGPTNRKRTHDQSEDDESCDDTDDSNIDIDDYQDEDDEDDEDDKDESLPEDSTDSNQDKDSKSPVVRGKRRRIDNKSLHDTNWEKTFQRLVAYKATHKNTMVPQEYKEDSKLGRWVKTQRQLFENNKLLEERLDKLDSINFVWKVDDTKWQKTFQRLVAYKGIHKNTMVPTQYDEDPSLGLWVSNQRQHFKKNELSKERLDQLHSIGFVWRVLR